MLPTNIKIIKISSDNTGFFRKDSDDDRYIYVDVSTGEIISDAKGYGYKTMESALKG